VLGRPIAHSLSPVLHRAAYAALGLGWTYRAVDCGVVELPATLHRLAADHAGVSLTKPLKLAAAGLVGSSDPIAAEVGAVNTIVFNGAEPSAWIGYNTDVAGVVAAVRETGVEVTGAPALVLGAGGAARAAVTALIRLGADPITVCARRMEAAVEVAALGGAAAGWAAAPRLVTGARLVVSTVPPAAAEELAGAGWPASAAVVDVIYQGWPTGLGRLAGAAGAPVVGGLAMLVAQAAEAVRLMTGREPPVAAMREAGERALSSKH